MRADIAGREVAGATVSRDRQSPAGGSDPRRIPVPELFQTQARRVPDAPALIHHRRVLSYAELNARANRLARYLISRGIGPEQLVAIRLGRNPDQVVAVLAVLKAGAAYLPIEPDYPADRVAFMLDDARPRLMLASRELAAARSATVDPLEFVLDAPGSPELLATFPDTDPSDADRVATLRGGGLAYVIYTSGSTGRPKGVAIEHDALSLYLDWACDLYPSVAGRALLHSPLAFDLTVTALFCPLISGGRAGWRLAGWLVAPPLRQGDAFAPAAAQRAARRVLAHRTSRRRRRAAAQREPDRMASAPPVRHRGQRVRSDGDHGRLLGLPG